MDFLLIEWFAGATFVGINAFRRYNTPPTNRESTTFQNFALYFVFYLVTILLLYTLLVALFDSSPALLEVVYRFMTGNPAAQLPEELSKLSAPMISALFLTTLLPSLPLLSRIDQALLNTFWDRGHIPTHIQEMAASMRRAPFNFSPEQTKKLHLRCKALEIDPDELLLDTGDSLDFRWARVNVVINSMEEWNSSEFGRLRRFMQKHTKDFARLNDMRELVNQEYIEFRADRAKGAASKKVAVYLERSIRELFRNATLFIAKAACVAEIAESGRASLIAQLGFEGGSKGFETLSGRQIATALVAILATFLAISTLEGFIRPGTLLLSEVLFVAFLMFFTYGAALVIALYLKSRVNMGYNELTRERSLEAYLWVGIITAASWLVVTVSYRYIGKMFTIEDSAVIVDKVLIDIGWSYPYALQSLALAVIISWIIDRHQSEGSINRLSPRQRLYDVGLSTGALVLASIVASSWMEGIGIFAEFATRDEGFRDPARLWWFVVKGGAVGAVVGWLVPMWFQINRAKAPDQIAGRLIAMNRRALSAEIRNLRPNELIEAVAATSAAVASIDDDVSRRERDVYQIICGHLAGLKHSDVDIDSAAKQLDECLELFERGELDLHGRLKKLEGLQLLEALMPYIASSIAHADGVYLDEEDEIVEQIRSFVGAPVIS